MRVYKGKKSYLSAALKAALPVMIGLSAVFPAGVSAAPKALDVIGIARVFGDGEKVSEAAVLYSEPIDPATVDAADFEVAGKKIEAVSVNSIPAMTTRKLAGKYVVLKFKQENTVSMNPLGKKPPRRGGNGDPGSGKTISHSDRVAPDLSIAVQQVGTVENTKGEAAPVMTEPLSSSRTLEPDLSRFTQQVYTDPKTGTQLPYNLFLPKNYDPSKKYPLVYFGVDMSGNNNDLTTPLYQGNGAIVWTEPEFQRKHPCIVVAPQYTDSLVNKLGMMTTDDNVWTPGLELVKDFLYDMLDTYSVDKDRVYGTGQSQGGMANIAISDRYPDLFAAQYLVACQWNTNEMMALKDKKLWITVCEGDTKAFPGMNAATSMWEKAGTKVARNTEFWDSTASPAVLDKKVDAMIREGAPINYTVFKGGNHMYTWSFAYQIPEIREWIFAQHK
jgi:predicted peptidase